MSINTTAIASRVASIGVTLAQAQTVVSEAISLIIMAEQVYEGLKGSEKFSAVQAGIKTLADQLGVSDKFDALWHVMGPIVSLIVTIFNLRKLWPVPAPAQAA